MRLGQTWVWAGDSYSALAPESRGQGCFDSHVNGSLVMKELKQPWLHWQSMNATIQLAPDDPLRRNPPSAPGQLYLDSLARYDFALEEGEFRQPGDAFFAFVVLEAAFEDVEVINQLVRRKIISAHFAASVLMVDFPNPVFSPARATLLGYVPASATLDPAGGGVSQQVAEMIVQAAGSLPAGSPEAQFTDNWRLADSAWRDVFAGRIQDYMDAVTTRVVTAQGFDDYVRLAESRRREFKSMRLNEFRLTLPVTNIPPDVPLLQMNHDGTISEKPAKPVTEG